VSLQCRRLAGDDAALIERLERAYPAAMRHGRDALAARLTELETSGLSFSWIAEEDGECQGYLVAWLTRSMVDTPRPEAVILVDDVRVVNAQGNVLYRLLKEMGEDLVERGHADKHVEGVCRRNAYKLFEEHAAPIRRLGYEMLAKYEYWDETLGEEMCWMRWHPVQRVSSAIRLDDQAIISGGKAVEQIDPVDLLNTMDVLEVLDHIAIDALNDTMSDDTSLHDTMTDDTVLYETASDVRVDDLA